MPGGPRSVDVGAADSCDRPQDFSEDGGNAERLGQNVGKACVVGAGGVGPDESGVSHLPGGDQAGLLRMLNLPVDRRMRGARPFCDLGEAELKVRVSQLQRKDLTLLLNLALPQRATTSAAERHLFLADQPCGTCERIITCRGGPPRV